MSDRWGFGEARHALWEGDRIVFDSMRDMGLSAADAKRIEDLLNAGEAAVEMRARIAALADRFLADAERSEAELVAVGDRGGAVDIEGVRDFVRRVHEALA